MTFDRCYGCMSELHGSAVCPVCGFSKQLYTQPKHALGPGTILHGRYHVGKMLGRGGFGITYIGFDDVLSTRVAIKEYYPEGAFIMREPGSSRILWENESFEEGYSHDDCLNLVKEAKKMERLDSITGIARIQDVFLENETSYLVMDFIEGQTLKQLVEHNGPLRFEEAKNYLVPAMRTLSQIHKHQFIHRDISPDNIMIQTNGDVFLLDLGSAKETSGLKKRATSQLVTKDGYSPMEQYSDSGVVGVWTDVYAMAATVLYALTSRQPPSPMERMFFGKEEELLLRIERLDAPESAKEGLRAGLAAKVEERLRNVEELLRALYGENTKPEEGTLASAKKERKLYSIRKAAAYVSIFALLLLTAVVANKLLRQARQRNVLLTPESESEAEFSSSPQTADPAKSLAGEDENNSLTMMETGTTHMADLPVLGAFLAPKSGAEVTDLLKLSGWVLVSEHLEELSADDLEICIVPASDYEDPEHYELSRAIICSGSSVLTCSNMTEKALQIRRNRNKDEIDAARGVDFKGQIDLSGCESGKYILMLFAVDPKDGKREIAAETDFRLLVAPREAADLSEFLTKFSVSETRLDSYSSKSEQFSIGIDAETAEGLIEANPQQIIFTGWFQADPGATFGVYVRIDGEFYAENSFEEQGGILRIDRYPRNLNMIGTESQDTVTGGNEDQGFIVSMSLPSLSSGVHVLLLSFNVILEDGTQEIVDLKPVTVMVDLTEPISESRITEIVKNWEQQLP